MKTKKKSLLQAFLIFFAMPLLLNGQNTPGTSRLEKIAIRRSRFIPEMFSEWNHTGGVKADSIRIERDSLIINYYLSPSSSHIPIRPSLIGDLNRRTYSELRNRFRKYHVKFWIRQRLIDEYIPNVYRDSAYKPDLKRFAARYSGKQLVTHENENYPGGLTGDHIALWPSHGYFFDQQLDRWQWQRARLWQTVEDIFPWSFTSAYLVPMLENAGANVLLPRERDTQVNEVIVDADLCMPAGSLIHQGGKWDSGDTGFRWSDTLFTSQNPFLEGTSLRADITPADTVWIRYIPDIPETGDYAVYVSYQKTGNCISDVPYKVNHTGGSDLFHVNQCMGYGTWIYLGTFRFLKGIHADSGSVVIDAHNLEGSLGSDAVKFGGGMGNVARKPGIQQLMRQRSANDGSVPLSAMQTDSIDYTWKTSGKPRWMEGSRYYLQYAGMPDTITYSLNEGRNDYNDDYMSRPEWVNFLVGPARTQYSGKYAGGKNIPVDLSLAFHTDAGVTGNDSIIGTLGIYSTIRNDGVFPDGRSKLSSRDLTDIVQTQLVNDIRNRMNPHWTRRGLWDREYSEAWRPVVPSMLLELLSHQNLADMKFGLDPRFKFLAARAVYKGILRYLADQQNRSATIQPLPPDHMAIEPLSGKQIRISWAQVRDPLEPSALAEGYNIYRRTGDSGFAPPVFTKDPWIVIDLPEWKTIYSFRVSSVNAGGESLPGETLSVSLLPDSKPVLIVNAFDRICAPAFFDRGEMAGIAWWTDEGVPYIKDLSFTGYQYNFNRNSEWLHDDSQGWGASQSDAETIPNTGNTFDFPFIHGQALRNAGRSFVSVSDEVFEQPDFNMDPYEIIDVIFGEERGTDSFTGNSGKEFRVFTDGMIRSLTNFTRSGGNVLLSGAYIGTDMMENSDSAAINFAADVLHYIWRSGHATAKGNVIATDQGSEWFPRKLAFTTEFGSNVYRVESPDAIEPVGAGAFRLCRYESGGTSAGVGYNGNYKSVVLGFPFETIVSEQLRNEVMNKALIFLTSPPAP